MSPLTALVGAGTLSCLAQPTTPNVAAMMLKPKMPVFMISDLPRVKTRFYHGREAGCLRPSHYNCKTYALPRSATCQMICVPRAPDDSVAGFVGFYSRAIFLFQTCRIRVRAYIARRTEWVHNVGHRFERRSDCKSVRWLNCLRYEHCQPGDCRHQSSRAALTGARQSRQTEARRGGNRQRYRGG